MGITDNNLTKYYCTVVIAPFCVLQAIHTSNMMGGGGGGGGFGSKWIQMILLYFIYLE